MTHLVDAERLIDAFAESDAVIPGIVFAMLSMYFAGGPFEFNASAIAERLTNLAPSVRVNAEQLAALQPDLEKFFEPTSNGWIPRGGVLAFQGDASHMVHPGAGPGEAAH